MEEIDALADDLSPTMRHVLGRCCDDAGWWGEEETGCFREWRDVVAGRRYANFYGTVRALERRGLVVVKHPPGSCSMVALTRRGLRVAATLRLRELAVKDITK